MKIALGADHGGYELKEEIKKHLEGRGIPFVDFGTDSTASIDYPDMAVAPCKAVQSGECAYALLFCGTGVGISMAAHRMKGKYTRLHNDANALCLGGRVVGPGLACELVDLFIDTPFEGGERHTRRVEKLTALEG